MCRRRRRPGRGALDELAAGVRTLADVASALTAERGETPESELVTWTDAAGRPSPAIIGTSPFSGRPRRRTIIRRSPSWPIPQRAMQTTRPGRRRSSSGGSTSLPIARNGCSRRWTSASCSIPSGSCSRSGTGVADGALDPSYYDLLASEARLASFLAIAKGDVPAEHWFRLGRAARRRSGEARR